MKNKFMKWMRLTIAILFVSVASSLFGSAQANTTEAPAKALQLLIDNAMPGDTIVLEDGKYLGPAIINKQLTIKGSRHTVVTADGKPTVIDIRSNQVAIEGISIVQRLAGDSSAIIVNSDHVSLDNLSIETRGFGILLRNANEGIIKNNRIVWSGANNNERASMSKKNNGIDLYDSHDNRIEANEISDMRDGIYLENSHRSNVANNLIYRSRYGIHCMYTDGTRIIGNQGEYNVTGAMIMGVRDAVVSNNSFRKQSENVNSQGLLLFDVQTSLIEDNVVEGNRVGIYMEQSSNNELRNNSVLRNFMGIQFLESSDNRFNHNQLIANVIEAEALESSGNRLDSNYWDSVQGLDVNDDGLSDISYAINPFYQRLIQKTPAFQLFFQSPGMIYLSNLFMNDKDNWATDRTPLMSLPPALADRTNLPQETRSYVWIASLILLSASLTIIYKGVHRK
ncbi:right-handed parallel beta-helix repeat-containing protein [Cohnella mopanensis]|uniref:right-handed parallel beta-helix repeat-containing protein n=1 Tax=Cohnella mopanensis TaxID=2911966 RepID=UPI001EF780D7|nr:right-handed parallel beta-helix repeat-containing protein [Cohnella mopanensis]